MINKLALIGFRNFKEETVTFEKGLNLITGLNGQGKSNLLEGIYFACLGYSPRTRKDNNIIQWGVESFVLRLEGFLEGEQNALADIHTHSHSVQIFANGKKDVRINGEKFEKLSVLRGYFPCIYFSPDDIGLINDGPQERRAFLDQVLCQFSESYMLNLRQYNRVLRQRNEVLKKPHLYNQDVLDVLTEQLIDSGAKIAAERLKFLEGYFKSCAEIYRSISLGRDSFAGFYESAYASMTTAATTESPEEQIVTSLENIYRQKSEEEKRMGITLFGPHRDNLLFMLDGEKAREYASQGQKRLIALSLKLSAAESLKNKLQKPPLLLLDDVFAELDEDRRKMLCKYVEESPQVILAAPRQEDLPFSVQKHIVLSGGRQDLDIKN